MNKDMGSKSHPDTDEYEDGISIITPTYKGEKHIQRLLDSIGKQKLSPRLFEHIIIVNGDLDRTPQIIKEFQDKNPKLNIKVLFSEAANAASARNIGIQEASRKYSTLIDDDDHISPNYLNEMYKNAASDRIVVAGFIDEDAGTGKLSPSYITPELIKNSGEIDDPYGKLVAALTINVIKLIPTHKLKQVRYNTELGSGLDVAFYSRLFAKFNFKFYVINKREKAIYYRVTRDNSLSRRPLSYQFNVTERLRVIKDLNESISIAEEEETQNFLRGKVTAQTMFINRYLVKNPGDHQQVCQDVKKAQLDYFPYQHMNRGLAKKLVISYNFPPYSSTSGNNMAKRVNEKGDLVDVVQNKVKRRPVDEKLNLLADEYIDERIFTNTPYAFSSWRGIKEFCREGMEKIGDVIEKKGEYEEVYSRAMFPASHFLAFHYKMKHPGVKWIAEFSDPLIYDIKGDIRGNFPEATVDPEYNHQMNELLRRDGFKEYWDGNLFFLCEYLPYAFADELIFTNENQKNLMISQFPYSKEMAEVIGDKSVVKAHSIPKSEFYSLESCEYPLDENLVNLAYFGAFYETRDLNDIFLALYTLEPDYKDKCKIHFFTSNADSYRELMNCNPVSHNVEVNPYVNFLEFLNLTTKFDCLIVNDTFTKGYKDVNPYLPSKLSDYLGSGSDIWMIYEEGSIMSRYDVKYRSKIGDLESIENMLQKIIADHLQEENSTP